MHRTIKNHSVNKLRDEDLISLEDRRYACPGFFRMPLANDGRICRIKLPLGRISAQQLKMVAQSSKLFGNDVIELTTRGNIQLRGIGDQTQALLISALQSAGLGPLSAGGDDIRNVMVSPTAGIDREALVDTLPLASQLLNDIQTDETYQRLSPKFSILINGGEATENNFHLSDIWLSINPDLQHYAVGLASCPAQGEQGILPIGLVHKDQAFSLILAIMDRFVRTSMENRIIQRMRDIFKFGQSEEFIRSIANTSLLKPWSALATRMQVQSKCIGIFRQCNGFYYIGAKPRLASLNSNSLLELVAVLERRKQCSPIRLSSYQSVIIPDCSLAEAQQMVDELAGQNWVVDESDPLSRLISCAGKPKCRAGLSNVKRDIIRLAALLGPVPFPPIHLTACEKSCASNMPYPHTLMAVAEGHYNLYEKSKCGSSKFGQLIAENIELCEAAKLICRHLTKTESGD